MEKQEFYRIVNKLILPLFTIFFSVLCGMYPAFSDLETRGFFQKKPVIYLSPSVFLHRLCTGVSLFFTYLPDMFSA